MDRHFSERQYSDRSLCKFLDFLEEKGVKVNHVVTIHDTFYLVIYTWHEKIAYYG